MGAGLMWEEGQSEGQSGVGSAVLMDGFGRTGGQNGTSQLQLWHLH